MKKWGFAYLAFAILSVATTSLRADQSATVTEVINDVTHGTRSGSSSPASRGTSVHDGEYVQTAEKSRAELELPTKSITRLGASTIFNYSVSSNTVDLQEGDILFCKPSNAQKLLIQTAAVTAGITGTTGFVSVQGEGKKKTYIIGLIEGHAIAYADEHPFPLGPGDILTFRPGTRPFVFAYDVPRFVNSSSLVKGFHSELPNQGAIDKELAEYADDVSRGFIEPPSKAIDYSGAIPVVSSVVYDNEPSSSGKPSGTPTPTPSPTSPTSPYSGRGGSPFGTSGGH